MPPNPSKNDVMMILKEIFLQAIPETYFNPFVSSIIPDAIGTAKSKFTPNILRIGKSEAAKILIILLCSKIDNITENKTINPSNHYNVINGFFYTFR